MTQITKRKEEVPLIIHFPGVSEVQTSFEKLFCAGTSSLQVGLPMRFPGMTPATRTSFRSAGWLRGLSEPLCNWVVLVLHISMVNKTRLNRSYIHRQQNTFE